MLEGRKYLVIGGGSAGIGEAITRRLAETGADVFVSCDEPESPRLDGIEYPSNARIEVLDHANRSAVMHYVEGLPAEIDGVVICQIAFEIEDPAKFDFGLWDRLLEVNLSMPNAVVHAAAPRMRDEGAILVVTSTEAFVGSFGASAYAASKAAVHNLVMTHANNLGGRSIRVNALAAGWIGGVMDTDEVFEMSRRITPLGRLGTPEEVAAAASFLLSDDASFVNGSVLTVDGGYRGVDAIAKYEFEHAQAN